MENIRLYDINWFVGKNYAELDSIIIANRLPLRLEPCIDQAGNVICFVMLDTNTGATYDLYFGGFGEGHFNLPITDIIPV